MNLNDADHQIRESGIQSLIPIRLFGTDPQPMTYIHGADASSISVLPVSAFGLFIKMSCAVFETPRDLSQQ